MSKASEIQKLGKLTVRELFARFPDEEACLTHIMEVRYGLRHTCAACEQYSTFHRLADRRAFSCARCGHHVYPTAATVFQDTRTPLQVWFYAIYLFVTTRHGVSGKELQRTLGVTYKTAYRMGQQIRKLMAKADGFKMMQGHVEIDEAYMGGARTGFGPGPAGKQIIMGIVERGGRTVAKSVPNLKMDSVRPFIYQNVKAGSAVSTDEANIYKLLKSAGYDHKSVNHSKYEWTKYNYRRGEYHHTNSVESFWRLFKNSIRSTHIHVSEKYMDRYLNEFTFRSNHRGMVNAMFDLLIGSV